MSRSAIAWILGLFLGVGVGLALRASAAPAAAPGPTCGAPCAAAYSAIARALPADGGHRLADALLATPGFDYGRLARALGIPTNAQLRVQWRRRCGTLFSDDRRSANACYRLILPSTYRYLDEPPPAA
jgi:hypothetical protein